jgi:hypothetical protein
MTGSGAEKPFARLARMLFAAGIVFGSAAVGYWSSLIWPLPNGPGSEARVGAEVAAARAEPAPGTSESSSAEGMTASQVASDAKARTFDPVVAIPPLAAEVRNLADPAVMVKASLTGHANDATPAASQSAKVEKPAEVGEASAGDTERTDAAPTRSAKASRRTVRIERRARTTSGAPKMAQSAAPSGGNYERVPILKQFMTSTNKY